MQIEQQESHWPAITTPTGLVLRLTKALHAYGTTTYDLERWVLSVARKLGIGVECFAFPTMIMVQTSIGDQHDNYLIRTLPYDINLEKLTRCQDLAERIIHDEVQLAEAARELAAITDDAPRWNAGLVIGSFGLVSAGVARVFGGDWAEMVCSLLIGWLVGFLAIRSARSAVLTHLFPMLAAMLSTLASYALARAFGHDAVYTTLVSGVIVLLPGFTIMTGLAELATHNLVSGTARLAGAFTLFVLMGFGVAIGDQIGMQFLPTLTRTAPNLLPVWTEWIAVLMCSVGFMTIFQARLRDIGWIVLAGLIAYATARFGTHAFGPVIGAFLGAFVIGSASHLYRFLMEKPNAIMLVPGIILLVPGSMGFRGLHALLEQDTLSGLDTIFRMVLAAIALVVGLLMSSVFALPTRRERRARKRRKAAAAAAN